MNISNMKTLIQEINRDIRDEIKIMEVCGTHTQAIVQHGITTLIDPKIQLLSGPGCPVCVTDETDIDYMIELIDQEDIMVATFGDMMRVPGTEQTLGEQREKGKRIQIVYSPMDVISLAENNKGQRIIFFGVGFETTAPLIAATIQHAKQKNLQNLLFYICLKRMKPILEFILDDSIERPHAIMCPGHVAAIKGAEYFRFIVDQYKVPSVVCGFELEDMITGIYCLTKQVKQEYPLQFENLYKRCVRPQGNKNGNHLLSEVFTLEDAVWRGIGTVPVSGFRLNIEYERFDALRVFGIERKEKVNTASCQCTEVILGKKIPKECPNFKKSCTPKRPKGPCMVSREGSCFIYFTYGRDV